MNNSTRLDSAKQVRFAFFGTPHLATFFLDELEKEGLVPSLIVTTPDKQKGRGMDTSAPPVKEWGLQRNINILQPETLSDDTIAALKKEQCDIFVVIYYGKILPRAILDIPAHGTLNIHFSLLPRWRGTSPVRAAIANDDREVGTTILLLDEKIDHGPVIAQKKISVREWPIRATELEQLATLESARLFKGIVRQWVAGEIEAHEQNHDVATMCPKFEKEDGLLDLSADAYKNLLKIRAFDSTIGTYAFFERGSKKIRVQILDAHIDGNKLVIDTVKPEGKKEMPYQDFLRSGAIPL